MRTRERIERRLWAGGDGLDGSGRRDGPPRPRRRPAVGALAAVALLVGLLGFQQLGGGEARKAEDGKRGTRTATVARRTLVERESVEGTLGYSGGRAVVNRLATGDGSAGGGSGGGGNPSGGAGSGGASSGGAGYDTASASASGSSTGSASSAGAGSSSGSPSGQSASSSGQRASGGRRSSTGARASVASQASGRDAAGDDKGTDGKRDRKGKGKGGKRGDHDERRAGDRNRGRDRRGADGDWSHGGGRSGASGGSKVSGAGGAGGGGGGGGRRADGGSNGRGGGSAGGGASQGSGTVTRLAREGSILNRGETLYELDNRPVLLMYGSVPAYRELSTATTDGPDVRQLEQNLAALGFGAGVSVDEDFTAATAAAVKRWQRSLGLPQTGGIELGRVVFLPGARRVGNHKTKIGGVLGTGAEVLETTSIKRVVTVELDVAKQSLVRGADKVTVTLPDGTTVSGRIARVGRIARKKDDGGGGGDGGVPGGGSGSQGGELVIDLSIVLGSRRGVSRLDQAPVTVGIAQETRRDALAVPVTALVARPGGGYGVELVRGGRWRLVAVETGLFASGLVEISGRGIRAGTKVAIPEEA